MMVCRLGKRNQTEYKLEISHASLTVPRKENTAEEPII
jgi:hypothetical protein